MKLLMTIIATFTLIIMLQTNCQAVRSAANPADVAVNAEAKKSAKLTKKLEKFKRKYQRKANKKNLNNDDSVIDFDDPVDKWMWFWIFGWGGGLVLSILAGVTKIGALFFVASAAYLFGTVALILWIVKKFG